MTNTTKGGQHTEHQYKCRHGTHTVTTEHDMTYFCPTSNCVCCGEFFGWVDIGFGPKGGGHVWLPHNTCRFCGGYNRYYGDWSGVFVYKSGKEIPITELYPDKYTDLPTRDELEGMYGDQVDVDI